MCDNIVTLNHWIIGARCPNCEMSILCLVIEILPINAWLIAIEGGMIVWFEILYLLHTHVHWVDIHHLNSSILIPCWENKIAIVLKCYLISTYHQWFCNHNFIVGTRVLSHNCRQLVIGIADAFTTLCGNNKIYLLVVSIVVYIGVGTNFSINSHCVFTHREACLEQYVIGVVLTIYLEHVVSTLGNNEIIIWNTEIIIKIMHKSCLARLVVLDIGLIKTVDILTLHKLWGLPVGIAVRHAVAQILDF